MPRLRWVPTRRRRGMVFAVQMNSLPLIVAFDDQTQRMTESGIIGYVLQERPEATVLPVVVLRDGERMEFQMSLE